MQNSDQGPWGGHRHIQWKGRQDVHISVSEINVFATKNGWKLFKQYIFPLPENVSDYPYDQLKQLVPLHMQAIGCRLLVFQTDWLLVAPGSDMETYYNGFVVLSADGTEWMMYHLWGG